MVIKNKNKYNKYKQLANLDSNTDNTILKRIEKNDEYQQLKTDLNTELKTLKSDYIKLDNQVSSKNLEELRNKNLNKKINQEFEQTKKGTLRKINTTRTVSVNEAVKDTLEGNKEIDLALVRQGNFNMNDWKDNLIVNVGNFSDLKKKTVKLLEKIELDKAKLDYLKNLELDVFTEYVVKINDLDEFFDLLDWDVKTISKKIYEKTTNYKKNKTKEIMKAKIGGVVASIIIGLFTGLMTYKENFTDNNFNEIENDFNEFKKRIKEHIDNDTFDKYKYNLFVKEMETKLDYFSKKYNYSIDYILKRLNISTNIYELPLEQVMILNKLKLDDSKNEFENLNYIIFARNLYNRLSIIDKEQFLKLSMEDQDIIIKNEYKRIFNNIENNIKKNNYNNLIINNINNNLISYRKVINIYYIIIIIAIILFIILFLK